MSERASAGPGRRAVLRWAWRLFRREWRQQALVLTLVTVAVAAAVAGAAIAVNAASHKGGELGDAGAMIRIDNTDAATAHAGVAAARRQFGRVEVIGHSAEAVPGSATPLDLRAQDPHGSYGRSMLRLRDGRYPARNGEVALTTDAAALLSARIGDRVDLGRNPRTVVGLVENPGNLDDAFALVAPTEISASDSLVLLLAFDQSGGRTEVPAAVPGQKEFRILGHAGNQNAVAAGVLIVVTLAMALVCLIAAAGFVVVAQRRQRQLGLLAAIGATDRHLRLIMIANGAIVGVLAALVGGALGVLGWIAAHPAVEAAAALRIDRFDLPWGLIVECMLLAAVASTAAAWWPARITARLPVMIALSGRPTRPRPVHRSLLLAVALIAIGIVAITAAQPNGDRVQPAFMVAGILAVVIGVVLAAPGMIRLLAFPARHLPFAPRLALRDLVRYQTRAAAALTAITLALGVSVTVVVISKVNTPSSDEGNLSDRQLVVSVGDPRTAPDPTLGTDDLARLDAVAAKVADAVGGSQPLTLNVAINPTTAGDPSVREPIGAVTPVDHGFRFVSQAYVITPQLLRRYAIDPSTVRADTELLTSHDGNVVLLDSSVRETPSESRTRVQRVDLPSFTAAPTSFVTSHALRRHRWVAARAGWLIETARPLTARQIDAAAATAAGAGLTVEARDSSDGANMLRNIATVVGALLALAIVAMTIGLIRGESAGDLRTLTATGAGPRTRRTLTASTAAALAFLGVLLGAGGAYLAMVAGYHADLSRLARPPVGNLLALAIGLPLVAGAAGWLLAGREPKAFARQTLD